jgi:YD repeat-containing protein
MPIPLNDTTQKRPHTAQLQVHRNQPAVLCGVCDSAAWSTPPTGSIAYKYDAADNLIQIGSTQQVFNNADQLCWTASAVGTCATPPSGATRYQYDIRGNRTAMTPAVGPTQTLGYDQANRLTRFAGSSATTYTYNAGSLRMSKTVTSTPHSSSGTLAEVCLSC